MEIIKSLLKQGITPYLEGPPGTGKTAMARAIALDMKLKLIELHPLNMTPEDVVGLPYRDNDGTTYCPPQWAVHASREACLILVDEYPQALRAVRCALAPLILDGRVGNLALHADTRTIVTGNRPEDCAGAERLETHLLNRVCLIPFPASVENLSKWWIKSQKDPSFIAFWKWSPESFYTFNSKSRKPFASPRSWDRLETVLTANPTLSETDLMAIAEGMIGEIAPAFLGFRRSIANANPDEWLNDPSKPLPEGEKLFALAAAIPVRAIERGKETSALSLAVRFPPELAVFCAKSLMSKVSTAKQQELLATKEYRVLRDAVLLPLLSNK